MLKIWQCPLSSRWFENQDSLINIQQRRRPKNLEQKKWETFLTTYQMHSKDIDNFIHKNFTMNIWIITDTLQ